MRRWLRSRRTTGAEEEVQQNGHDDRQEERRRQMQGVEHGEERENHQRDMTDVDLPAQEPVDS